MMVAWLVAVRVVTSDQSVDVSAGRADTVV